MEIPKIKDYRVRFAIGFVIEAEDEEQAEDEAIRLMYEEVSDNGSDGFNIDIDEFWGNIENEQQTRISKGNY